MTEALSTPDQIPDLPTVERYNEFISKLEFSDIRLVKLEAEALIPNPEPTEVGVQFRMSTALETFKELPNNFMVYAKGNAAFISHEDEDSKAGEISVVLCLYYKSSVPISESLFEVFSNLNVPTHAWPYFREYIHQTVTRFGWPTFLLPPYKTGVDDEEDEDTAKSSE